MKVREIDPEIREYIGYDPETGEFTWISNSLASKKKEGEKAGSIARNKGRPYYQIKFAGRSYVASRLAYYLVMGEELTSKYCLVPLDGDYLNLKFENLRVKSWNEIQLTRKVRKDTDNPYKNIQPINNKYHVYIQGKYYGGYEDINDAVIHRDRIIEKLIR